MKAKYDDTNLKHTLECLRTQVIDSIPYISDHVPDDIASPEDLFYFLRDKIKYKKDPAGLELLQCVQTLLSDKYNRHGKAGLGDCDCFTILALASCYHLGFAPQQVVIVGNSKNSPSHIYSLVYDDKKNKYVSMDLTNPYFDVQRPYKYKQTLNFTMKLELADNYLPLAGKTARKAKRAAKKEVKAQKKAVRQAGKVARVTARVAKRTARSENKTARKISTQERRTDRRVQKGERKAMKRATKTARKEKGLIRVQGKQEIIKARQQEQLDNIRNRQAEETYDNEYSPDSDQSYEPDEENFPGSTYMAPDSGGEYYDYEQMPEDYYSPEEEYEEEEEYTEQEMMDMGLPFIPAAIGLINKISKKVKGKVEQVKASKAGKVATKGASQYNEIMALKSENKTLKSDLAREGKNKYIYGGVGSGVGMLAGILIGRATK